MEVVQGKSTNKKIIIAQEIAFAKVLAGNNKTLRDRAIKKLKKWLTVRGNGKWAFEEDEFIRISTGLFYCMWMSDKFLVQEELAESISQLIHCFEKNTNSALLFIKCFFKRLLMEWEGLDQYRVDKFNMLVRRFLRQSLVYCKRKHWDESVLSELMKIFYFVVLHKDNCLGFILHFIGIYAEEIAKVSKGKIKHETVLTLIEPLVKLMAKSKDGRIQEEVKNFFDHLLRQTDVGLEFEDRFNAWKQQGFPGTGPHCMKKEVTDKGKNVPVGNGNGLHGDDGFESDDDNLGDDDDEALDPRAGSVDVFLPQIPIDPDSIIGLLKKYENTPQTIPIGRKRLRSWIHKFYAMKKGRFPVKIKKDPILDQKNKKRSAVRNAKQLLEFTESLDAGPVRTKDLIDISKELDGDEPEENMELDKNKERNTKDLGVANKIEMKNKVNDSNESEQDSLENNKKMKKKRIKAKKKKTLLNPYAKEAIAKMKETANSLPENNHISPLKENKKQLKMVGKNSTKLEKDQLAGAGKEKMRKKINDINTSPKVTESKKTVKLLKNKEIGNGLENGEGKKLIENVPVADEAEVCKSPQNSTPVKKRKILSSWQVQDLDTSSPEYYKIKTPKIIKLEKKTSEGWNAEENQEPGKSNEDSSDDKSELVIKPKEEFSPVFWEKAKAKVGKKFPKSKNKDLVLNPYALMNNSNSKSPRLRRISFALDRNMAQENEEYLEEVRNSPKVPFDGSKKPSQSVLKSGLSPSPVNPFYRFKRIKFST